MSEATTTATPKEQVAQALQRDLAAVCGVVHAASAEMVALIGRVLATDSWEGWGIRSPEHWVTWQCGVSPGRARQLVAVARRLADRPVTERLFQGGELSLDQVSVVCRFVPPRYEAAAADLARFASVSQLSWVLGRYVFGEGRLERRPAPDDPQRTLSFRPEDADWWRISGCLPLDEGLAVEQALIAHREALVSEHRAEGDERPRVSWPDALVAMAEASLAGVGGGRPVSARTQVLVHFHLQDDDPLAPPADDPLAPPWETGRLWGEVHLGARLPNWVVGQILCDSTWKALFDSAGVTVNVGRAQRSAPERTKLAVEQRDGGCRVPGCSRKRWLHCHHIRFWCEGGATDTGNLCCLCPAHHRALHKGLLQVDGDADHSDGLTFTDARGRVLTDHAPPTRPPPGATPAEAAKGLGIAEGHYRHPTGDKGQWDQLWLAPQEPSAN